MALGLILTLRIPMNTVITARTCNFSCKSVYWQGDCEWQTWNRAAAEVKLAQEKYASKLDFVSAGAEVSSAKQNGKKPGKLNFYLNSKTSTYFDWLFKKLFTFNVAIVFNWWWWWGGMNRELAPTNNSDDRKSSLMKNLLNEWPLVILCQRPLRQFHLSSHSLVQYCSRKWNLKKIVNEQQKNAIISPFSSTQVYNIQGKTKHTNCICICICLHWNSSEIVCVNGKIWEREKCDALVLVPLHDFGGGKYHIHHLIEIENF